ncbi:MAG TPA: hypothetical protein PK020_01430 [Ilumatobacteraceae bacterium]|nr:hypothetical protein [Ilumatobacteraceae bacterium]
MTTHGTTQAFANWKELVTFNDHGPSLTTLVATPHLKAVLVGLRADQAIPAHPSPEAVYHFLQGSGTMTVDEQDFSIEVGVTIVVADGSQRGMRATSDIVFLGTTVPAGLTT